MALGQGALGAPSFANLVVPILLCIPIWWFLLIRPQRQQEKKHREMIESLKPGAKVVTSGGMYGVVDKAGDKTFRLKIADNVRIDVLKSAITGLQPSEGETTPDRI